jgi:hypothetical protein
MTTLNEIKKIMPAADGAPITSLTLKAMRHSEPSPKSAENTAHIDKKA